MIPDSHHLTRVFLFRADDIHRPPLLRRCLKVILHVAHQIFTTKSNLHNNLVNEMSKNEISDLGYVLLLIRRKDII